MSKKRVQYKCGHNKRQSIVLDHKIITWDTFLNWRASVGDYGTKEKCWKCYLNSQNVQEKNNG